MSYQRKQAHILGPVDMAFMYVDRPETPMNIGAMTIFEGKIDFQEFLHLVDARIPDAPIYQHRLMQAPLGLSQPMWVFDPDFYIGNHVFQVILDAPGTDEQLRELAGRLVSGMLDRSKPLWEIYLITGLSGDRTAVFFKVHHCMVDGLAAVELFSILLDVTVDVQPLPNKPVYDPPRLPNFLDLIAASARTDVPYKLNMLKKLGHDFLNLGAIFQDKEKRRKALIGLSYLVNDNLTPIKKLPINGQNSGRIVLAWTEFSLSEVKAFRSAHAASVNDVMLTILSHALSRYMKTHGGRNGQGFIRFLVPVNVRDEAEKGAFGNRISVLPIDIPLGMDGPLERLRVVTDYTQVMKQSALSHTLDMVLTLPALAPSVTQPLVWAFAPAAFALLAHSWCTNVAGPQIPVYLLGRQMLHTYGYFPLNPSMGLATVITSYNQRISMTLVADEAIVPDVTELRQLLEESYQSLRAAAQMSEIEPFDPSPGSGDTSESTENRLEAAVTEPRISVPSLDSGWKGDAEPPAVPGTVVQENVVDTGVSEDLELDSEEKAAEPQFVEQTANLGISTPIPSVNGNSASQFDVVGLQSPSAAPNPVRAVRAKLFSSEWAYAFQEALNQNKIYWRVSTRWQAGSIALVMQASPGHDFPQPAAVILDLYKGRCREAHTLTPAEALVDAAFVIEGDYSTWMKVLRGQAEPLLMIVRGKLRLRKGSLAKLLPFAQSAQELVHTAQQIS